MSMLVSSRLVSMAHSLADRDEKLGARQRDISRCRMQPHMRGSSTEALCLAHKREGQLHIVDETNGVQMVFTL